MIKASIPQSGYVPGQTIVVSGEISNQSRVSPEYVKFTLRQIVHYNSQTPHVKTLEEIVDICEQRVTGLDDKSMSQLKQELVIPPIPPTIYMLSRVININYEVKVEVKVRGAHLNPVIRLPITIGTYPLVNYPVVHNGPIPVQMVTGASAPTPDSPHVEPITLPLAGDRRTAEDLRKLKLYI